MFILPTIKTDFERITISCNAAATFVVQELPINPPPPYIYEHSQSGVE